MSRILMIGPGSMPIPSEGWGAIERVIWHLSNELKSRGHHVRIVNTQSRFLQASALRFRPDIVHVHFDAHIPLWHRLQACTRAVVVSTTHNPYAGWPDLWDDPVRSHIGRLLSLDHHLALSPEIAAQIVASRPDARCHVIPNGVDVDSYSAYSSSNGRAICLGRWEERKRQQELWNLLENDGEIRCDFVGPGAPDPESSSERLRILGPWTSEAVRAELGKYACLVLPSVAEAHALVVLEALASGIPVVVAPRASSNLDRRLGWIDVHELGPSFLEAIKLHTSGVAGRSTSAIRRDTAERFGWKRIADLYETALKDWNLS